jgi:serine/threonine protein kinase
VKVTDFGIARAASSAATATGIVLGTAGYMSPEQAKGEPVGLRSDLYSLDVVLYEMLTGNLPYEADSAIAQAINHINERPCSPRRANPDVPEALDALTMNLLATNPEDRYASAAELAYELERVRSGLPPAAIEKTERMTATLPPNPKERTQGTAVQPPVAAPTRVAGRRRGRLFPALAALLLGLALLGGAWALTRGFDGLSGFGGRIDENPQQPPAQSSNFSQVTPVEHQFTQQATPGQPQQTPAQSAGVPKAVAAQQQPAQRAQPIFWNGDDSADEDEGGED